MRILVLTFYYPPDLSAGSFRTHALVQELRSRVPPGSAIRIVTTMPNRYRSFERTPRAYEEDGGVCVHRIAVPAHRSGLLDQSRTFLSFARGVRKDLIGAQYDLVYATSSRLMTAALGAAVSRITKAPLYLDIRDIFVDTVKDVFKGPTAAALLPELSLIERQTIRAAARVNLVSPGFGEYFRSRYPTTPFDFFTNGIDDEFLQEDWSPSHGRSGPLQVLYAGNIGMGQGLHSILPELAARTAGAYDFVVVGDGGAKGHLETALTAGAVTNVKLVAPVGREALMKMYRDSDVLFLHLNDLSAFEKVLPSKVFEYAATGKPILAGVAGYAHKFIADEVANARVFSPCNAAEAVVALRTLQPHQTDRSAFVVKYRRDTIMRAMATSLLATAASPSTGDV